MADAQDRLLTQEQAGAILLASSRKLLTMREKGSGPPFLRIGRNIYYPESQLVEWLKAALRTTQGGANGTGQ
jgi:hypothetical protein